MHRNDALEGDASVLKRLSKNTRWQFARIRKKLNRKVHKAFIRERRRKLLLRKLKGQPREKPLRLSAPEIFSLESDATRGPLVHFLAELRQTVFSKPANGIVIDFAKTHRFISSATLLFYAELHRLIELMGDQVHVRCKPPKNDRACEVLRQIGVYHMCGQNIRKRHGYYDDVVHWRVAHGSLVDNSLCAPAIEEFEGQLAEPLVNGLFRGLGEAMTNAIHHAYLEIREDGLNYKPAHNDWWMFSQARQGYLSVVFCDLGIGIPKTLPIKKPGVFERILAMGRSSSDAACIEYAIEDSRTRTGLSERGRGLGNIVNVVSGLKKGVVMVLSNRGFYLSKNGIEPKTYDLKDSILGTLIYWRVPLDGVLPHGK